MGKAKELKVKVIPSKIAKPFVIKHHYSGKVANNSKLHFGVFLDGYLHGVMSFGSSIDNRRMLGIVKGAEWGEFLELNRMAFDEYLPKNSESRALSIAIKMIRKQAPQIKWIVSFADATQCGDGAIYRAAGFVLTQINENKTMLEMPDGNIIADITLNLGCPKYPGNAGYWKKNGAKPLIGYMLRYIYFIDPESRKNLSCEEIPFSKIKEIGASMYRGIRIKDHAEK